MHGGGGEGMHGKGACVVGEGGYAWGMRGRRRPLQRTVRILLECILVYYSFLCNDDVSVFIMTRTLLPEVMICEGYDV